MTSQIKVDEEIGMLGEKHRQNPSRCRQHMHMLPEGVGGGGALRYRGGPHPRYVFRGRRGLF